MTPRKQPKKTLQTDAARLIEVCAGANSRLAARRITQFFDRELAGTGLSLAQLGLMAQVAAASDDTLGALAARMGLEQSSLSRNLQTLESAGLVEIANVEGDLRRRAAWLTDEGARRSRPRFRSGARHRRSWRRQCRWTSSGDWRSKPKRWFQS